MKTISGYRYVVSIPMGFESAVWTSTELYPTLGHAIDAMLARYPEADYPDATYQTMPDEDIVPE